MIEQAKIRVSAIPPIAASGHLNVVVETPRGSQIKYKFDEPSGLMRLHKIMPTGTIFPFDFGFLPSTRGADGDPLDVLILVEEPVSIGCVVESRLAGVVEGQQTQCGKGYRNDRLIAVAKMSRVYQRICSLRDLGHGLLDEIETFFVFYNKLQGRRFKPLGRCSPSQAMRLIRLGQLEYAKHSGSSLQEERGIS